jgi:hypothetical protein
VILKSPSRLVVNPFPFSLKTTFTKGRGSPVSESNIFPFRVAWEKALKVNSVRSGISRIFLNIILNNVSATPNYKECTKI